MALTISVAVLLAFLPSPLPAQATSGSPSFEIADVHSSPYSRIPFARATTHGDRYVIRQANMVDLISRAYSVDPDNVLGGPAWLETDRFDIYAKTAHKTSPADLKLMLRALLADRFKLVVHPDSRPLPAFALTLGKGAPKMTESDGTANPECRFIDPPPNPPAGSVPLYSFSCHNITMETFAEHVHQWAGDYLNKPVVDATGLKGSYDFDFKFHSKGRAARAGADGITIFDAIDKQLGLKLEVKTGPLPVIVVDSANEAPSPNVPGLEKILPAPPPPEFEVATVRPSTPEEQFGGRIDGGQASLHAGTLKFMITFAWDITEEMLVGAPKWVDTDRFDILAKASSESPTSEPGAPEMDPDDLRLMMRKFLADRFKLAAHMEDRPLDAYTLLPGSPKLKTADPSNRTGCKEGPGADGKDPRIANPILGRLLTCHNMTMSQFAALLQSQASGYIHTPVLDSTGIDGAFDFTLSFSSIGQLQNGGGPPPPPPPGDTSAALSASDPNGGLSLFDAINKQLGLKLVKQKRPVPALVIDHIEEKPTEN